MAQHHEAPVLQSLALWSNADFPAVVATQGSCRLHDGRVVLGIPTPLAAGRRRIRLRIARTELRRGTVAFPRWTDCARALPLDASMLTALDSVLGSASMTTRVYGSFGWQHLTGLAYVRESSDLDLLLEATDVARADQVATALATLDFTRPRLDGEICFDDGSAVAWREWVEWRIGRHPSVLVKRLEGPALRGDASRLRRCAAEGKGT